LIVGLTGTRFGGTAEQLRNLEEIWVWLRPRALHHGLCRGVDEEGHELMRRLDPLVRIHGHPATDDGWRIDVAVDVLWKPLPYLERNHLLVDAVEVLFALPAEERERLRSGTWATVRYARSRSVPVHLLRPSGAVEVLS
jgi:hypothetical protein